MESNRYGNNSGVASRGNNDGNDDRQRDVDNTPSWIQKRKRVRFPTNKSGEPSVMVISAACFNITPGGRAKPMPIMIDNGLPAIAIRFGPDKDKEISFKVSLDSCAGLNIGNLRVH